MPTQTKKITIDTAAIFTGKVLGLLLGIIRLNYLATHLGVGSFGILNFATYFCSLFNVLFDFGLSQIVVRNISRNLSHTLQIVGRTLILKLGIVFVASLLIGVTSIVSNFDPTTSWAVLLTTIAFAINGISMVFLSALQAHRKMKLVSVLTVLGELISSITIIIIIQNYPYINTALIISIIVTVINLSILILVFRKSIGIPEYKFDIQSWKELLVESTPIAVSSLGISIYLFIGSTILKYSRGDIEVGIYSSAYKIVSILTLVPASFTQVVYPVFSNFMITAKEKLGKVLTDSIRMIANLSFPIGIGTSLLSFNIFKIIFPVEYIEGAFLLQLLMLGTTIGYLNWVMYTFLIAINRQKFSMILSVFTGLYAFVIGLSLIPAYGYISVVFITLSVEVILFVSQMIYLNVIGYKPILLLPLIKTIIATTVMGIVLLIFNSFNIFLLIPIGAGAFVLVLLTIKGVGSQEKEIIRSLLNRLKIDSL